MSSFQINGKVAVVTGGASGIGLEYVKELLRCQAKAVAIADVNEIAGKQTIEDLSREFGANKTLFVKADVYNKKQFEEVFKQTLKAFNNIDILINNAGILNETIWEKETAININGTVNGILLGLENYITNYKTAEEGLIINTSSTAALETNAFIPIYSATKAAVLALTRNFGAAVHYERNKVKIIAICPGVTDTLLLREMINKTLSNEYKTVLVKALQARAKQQIQKPEQVAKRLIEIIERAKSGSVWVARFGEDPYEIDYLNNKRIDE